MWTREGKGRGGTNKALVFIRPFGEECLRQLRLAVHADAVTCGLCPWHDCRCAWCTAVWSQGPGPRLFVWLLVRSCILPRFSLVVAPT